MNCEGLEKLIMHGQHLEVVAKKKLKKPVAGAGV